MEKSPQSRIDQIAEVIAELKDPMSRDAGRVEGEEVRVEAVENIDHKLIRSLQMEATKLKVYS